MSVAGYWWLPPPEAFPRLSGEYTRAQDKQEAGEGDDGNSHQSTSSPLSLIINSNIPPKSDREQMETRQCRRFFEVNDLLKSMCLCSDFTL